jgi:protein-disulfide isomerase-like protein with CxxC motif
MSFNLFKQFWKANSGGELFEKSAALSKSEIMEVQKKIAELQGKGLPSSKIINALQKFNSKLMEKYRAEAAYWTGVKANDTQTVAQIGDDLGISKYKVILSPSACELCREKTNNGTKIFDQKDISKTGYGKFVPWHVNCYCILVPWA